MPNATPQAALALAHASLLGALPDARATQDDGPRKRRLALGLMAAEQASAKGTEAGCVAAIAALAGVQDEAKALDHADNARVRNCAKAAEDGLVALKKIDWHVVPPAPVLTVRGFATVSPGGTAVATLVLSAPAGADVTATVTIAGLAAADLADGLLSFPVKVPAGAGAAPLPLAFAAQVLTADKGGSLALAGAVGATLGTPAGFAFTLKAGTVVQPPPTLSLTGPGDVAASATAEVDAAATVALPAPTDHDVTAVYALTGQRDGDLLSPATGPVVIPAGQASAAIPIRVAPLTLPADRALSLALSAVVGAQDTPAPVGFALKANAVVTPPSSATSGMTPNNSDAAVDQVGAVGAWRGDPVTCYTVFNFGHTGWAQFVASYTKPGWAPFRIVPILAAKGVVPILTIPGLVVGGNDFGAAERGDYDHYHQDMAAWLAAQPWRTEVVLRLSRESNDPNQPFYYGADAATRRRWAAIHTRIFGIYKRALGDRAKWSFCVMKRADGWQDAYPDACHIVDIDAYLNTPVVKTQADFDQHWSAVQPHIDFAIQKGKPVAFSEWAIKDVEMPLGIQLQAAKYRELAAAGRLHHENYFNSTGSHSIFGATKFPLSAAAYVKAYSGK